MWEDPGTAFGSLYVETSDFTFALGWTIAALPVVERTPDPRLESLRMTSHHPALLLLLLLAAATGCQSSDPEPDPPAILQLASGPSVEIGRASGDPSQELYRVSGAVRLADGRIVVANSGSSELRYFDSSGDYLKSVGRRGGGPGEFTGDLTLLPYHGDSLLVWDARLRRFSLFDFNGAFVRVLAMPPGDTLTFPWDTWLYRGFWLEGVMPAHRGAVARLVDSIHSTDREPALRLLMARLDGGLLWVTRPSDRRRWTAYDATGRAVGTAALPLGLEPFQFGPDFILGRWMDDDDLEHVRLYAYTPDAHTNSEPLTTANDAPPVASADLIGKLATPGAADILTALSTLIGIQESYYADHAQYAHTADSLPFFASAEGALAILAGDRRGWAGVLVLPDYSLTCAIAVGTWTPPGWLEGIPKCG